MENKIDLSPLRNSYLQYFLVAQANLAKLTQEEGSHKRLYKKRRPTENRFA